MNIITEKSFIKHMSADWHYMEARRGQLIKSQRYHVRISRNVVLEKDAESGLD